MGPAMNMCVPAEQKLADFALFLKELGYTWKKRVDIPKHFP